MKNVVTSTKALTAKQVVNQVTVADIPNFCSGHKNISEPTINVGFVF